MKTKKSDFVEQVTLRVNAEVVGAIQKSGQSAPDWLRQAARNRIDGERQAETPTSKLEKQITALQQRIDDLKEGGIGTQREIARLQQSEAVAHAALAEMRKMLAAIRNHQATLEANQAELQRTLRAVENGINNTLVALGPTLLAAINQQLDQHAQAALDAAKAKEERLRALVPPAPPRTRL
jgi:chromosome segregation ATPase